MKLFSELQRVTKLLEEFPGQWAICGGIAASIYRSKARYTDDIDFALIDSTTISATSLAEKVIKELGYKEHIGFVPDPLNPGKQLQALLCAIDNDTEKFRGFDFLLPSQTWVTDAVKLAQKNLVDFGFAKIPTVTQESLIFAKLIALNSTPERYQDLDDIKDILKSNAIDLRFLNDLVTSSPIAFNDQVLGLLPDTDR